MLLIYEAIITAPLELSHYRKKMNTEYDSIYDTNSPGIDLDEFRVMVSGNAYYRAEKRGFEAGYEREDWHEAESEIRSIRRYWTKEET
jgi:hypothetical protein